MPNSFSIKPEKVGQLGGDIWNPKHFVKDKDSNSVASRSSRIRKISVEGAKPTSPSLKPKSTKKTQSVPPQTRKPSPGKLPSVTIGSPANHKTKKSKLSGKIKLASKIQLPIHDKSAHRTGTDNQRTIRSSSRINPLSTNAVASSPDSGTYFYGSRPDRINNPIEPGTSSSKEIGNDKANRIDYDKDVSFQSDISDMDASPSIRIESGVGENVIRAIHEIVATCIKGTHAEQAAVLSKFDCIGESLDYALLTRFFGTKSKDREESAKNVFQALVTSTDKDTTLFLIKLCRIITHGSARARTRLIRRLGRAEVTLCVIKALRARLKISNATDEDEYDFNKSGRLIVMSDQVIDELVGLLLHMSEKDPSFQSRIRDGGVLLLLCQNMAFGQPFSSHMQLSLFRRALLSSVNAEICGAYENFAKDLLERVEFLTHQTESTHVISFLFHLDLLYFILRDKPTRHRLIEEESIVTRLLALANHQLSILHELGAVDNLPRTSPQLPAIFMRLDAFTKAIESIHLLTYIRSAKDELINLDCLGMVTKGIDVVQNPVMKEFPGKNRLQDSLCSLYMSCLPTVRFPLSGIQFPLSFDLPTPIKQSRASVSPLKSCSSSKPGSSIENQDEILISEDDRFDEDDDIFTENENSRENELQRTDIEKDASLALAKQKQSELSAYDSYFSEFTEDPLPTPSKDFEGYSFHFKNHVMKTSSVLPFVKIAYPDLKDSDRDQIQQPLLVSHDALKEAVIQQLNNSKKSVQFSPRVVYDLDELCANSLFKSSSPSTVLTCEDSSRIGRMNLSKDHLLFESRFESGNLRRVTQISHHHYQLILNPDINQINDHYQWFYFEVSNMRANIPYTFEIVNCLKSTSMYSQGMQPVMYSVRDAVAGNPRWIRVGDSVCYYRNLFTDDIFEPEGEKNGKRPYFSIRFDVTFKSKGDICYFAYHYPYTYSFLMTNIDRYYSSLNPLLHFRKDIIGHSLGGNPIVMLTATAAGTKQDVATRKIIVISARVHPGESNSSWIMHGLLNELLCTKNETVDTLLTKFVFKIIPMLNPDGVINGSHRCSLAGVDLNRVWDKPSRTLHPEIFHSKGIIQYLTEVCHRTPWMFLDFHGHSRKSSIFLFGNNPEQSYKASDKKIHHDNEFTALPEILDKVSAYFSIDNCRFSIVPSKESSARVAIWRQFGVARSYTMESTYSGFETGPLKGLQIGTSELKKMGRELLVAILETLKTEKKKKKV